MLKSIGLLLAIATISHASAPLPKVYWDVARKRAYYLDLNSITKMKLLKCQETKDPSVAICVTEVHFVAVRYEPGEQKASVQKSKIEDDQEAKETNGAPR